MLEREREQVAEACRRLGELGLVPGTSGNVSARAGELVAISPTGAVLSGLRTEEVAVVDLDGGLQDGPLAPTSELDLHLGIYRRFDTAAVVHTHAPMATALACVVDELPCVHYQMLLLGGAVRVAPYATFGSAELAASVADALEGRSAALMANHGAVTIGRDPAVAVELTELLEWACTVYWRASALGTPRVLGEAEQAAVVTTALERGYGQTKPVERQG